MSHIKPGYSPSVFPQGWVLPNYTSFPEWITKTFAENEKKIEKNALRNIRSNSPCELLSNQKFVQNVIGSPESPYRGLLLYHGLGTGKTITSISVAESLSRDRDIVVMVPASLVQNYVDEIMKCGNNVFTFKRYWYFVENDVNEIEKMKKLGVDNSFIKKQKGVWTFKESKESNFDSLGPDQVKVKQQIENMIRNRYHFIHYNGITLEKIKEYGRDFFSQKTVIIDEIHNFISAVKNESKVRTILYHLLMETDDVKILGLSGTPIINDTNEIAFLANLLHGFIEFHSVYFVSNKYFNQKIDDIKKVLEKHKFIDYFEIHQNKGLIDIKLVPPHFEKISPTSYLVQKQNGDLFKTKGKNEQIRDVISHLVSSFNLTHNKTEIKKNLLLPLNEEFNKNFIVPIQDDFSEKIERNLIKNEKVIMRRLQSIISYFESFDESQFPKIRNIEIVKTQMSDYVFEKYEIIREKERRKEKLNQQKRGQEDGEMSSQSQNVYKAYSRALCLFCFPEDIPRIYPANLRKGALSETDDVDRVYTSAEEKYDKEGDENSNSNEKKSTKKNSVYDQKKNEAMSKLRKNAKKYLTGSGLQKYGIKYYEAMKRIEKSPGPVLIYSHFREVEGIGIMKEVLNAHKYNHLDLINKKDTGWELDLPKDKEKWTNPFYIVFTQDKIKNDQLKNILNSDFHNLLPRIREQVSELIEFKEKKENKKINGNVRGEIVKCMMITQSGAEGISLKNIRQVHILEPYWNAIRIKQVMGRAVRKDSHIALPKSERTVDVFKYIMTLGKHTLEEDKNMTSDEIIEKIAIRKEKQTQAMELLLQKTSIDCEINKQFHNHIDSCYRVPRAFGKFAYVQGDISQEITDNVENQKVRKNIIKKTIKTLFNRKTGKTIYYIDETKEIISTEKYEKNKEKEVIGVLEKRNDRLFPKYF